MLKKQDLGINPYVVNNGSRDQSLTGIGGPRVTLVSPGPGLWSLVLGPFGPDLGPDLDLTWDLDQDLSLTIWPKCTRKMLTI